MPLIRDVELQLAKIRKQLEDVFNGMHLTHDGILVAAGAARSETKFELENVLRSLANRLQGQMKLMTRVIERLGGRTPMSEDAEGRPELMSVGEKKGD